MLRFVLALLPLAGSCAAVMLNPSGVEIAKAVKNGALLADPSSGYPLKEYVIFEVPDARDIQPAWGDVDAVIVATPLERARHAGYVAKLSGQGIDVAEVRRLPEFRPGSLSIIVYAHGADRRDDSFADRFGSALLVFPMATVAATEITHSDPIETTYPLASFERERQVAVINYRFDLTALPKLARSRCVMKFTDPTGKSFDIPINLARYQ